jgi:hypothetical protein
MQQHHVLLRRGLDALNHLLPKILRNGLIDRRTHGVQFITWNLKDKGGFLPGPGPAPEETSFPIFIVSRLAPIKRSNS